MRQPPSRTARFATRLALALSTALLAGSAGRQTIPWRAAYAVACARFAAPVLA